MSVDYVALAEKLGSKLNTVGETAFKIGVAGVKVEALSQFAVFGVLSLGFGLYAYKLHKNLNDPDNGWSYDQEVFWSGIGIISGLISVSTLIACAAKFTDAMLAIYSPEYLVLRNLLNLVK